MLPMRALLFRGPVSLGLAALCSGCLGYPRLHWSKKSGTAAAVDGQPIAIRAELIKDCETPRGESSRTLKAVETRTDAQGRYSVTVRGLSWNWRNYLSLANCRSRIQLFVCRAVCKPADDIDIDVLGK